MPDEQTVEELKNRAELMGKYYFRGFGNCLAGTSAALSNYLSSPEDRNELKDEVLFLYSFIEDFYKKIPFEQIEGNKDFEPIFSARGLLSEYKKLLDSLLQEPTIGKEKELYELNKRIITTVEPYRWNFWGLNKRIRSIPENEKFYVKVVDWNGVEWHF